MSEQNYLLNHIRALKGCTDAKAWINESNIVSIKQALHQCTRPDWIVWYLAKSAIANRRQITKLMLDNSYDYVRLVLSKDDTPLGAKYLRMLGLSESYADGEISLDEAQKVCKLVLSGNLRSPNPIMERAKEAVSQLFSVNRKPENIYYTLRAAVLCELKGTTGDYIWKQSGIDLMAKYAHRLKPCAEKFLDDTAQAKIKELGYKGIF